MVRLSVDLLLAAPVRFNPAQDRELVLRGLKAPVIENLGVLQDKFDCLDLTDNDVAKLESFPQMRRLKTLLVSNNRVSRVADGLGSSLPALQHVVLTNNRISALGEVRALCALPSLTTLVLLGNPVTRQAHYRHFIIHFAPRLTSLDFQRVRAVERAAASKLFRSKLGRAYAEEVEELEAYLRKGELPPALREAAPEGGPQGPSVASGGDASGVVAEVEAS